MSVEISPCFFHIRRNDEQVAIQASLDFPKHPHYHFRFVPFEEAAQMRANELAAEVHRLSYSFAASRIPTEHRFIGATRNDGNIVRRNVVALNQILSKLLRNHDNVV